MELAADCCMFCSRARRYLGLNSGLNLLNRWALGLYGLKFPLIMTSAHMIFGSTALSPMMLLQESYASRHALVLQNDWKGLATIAIMNGFQIACNNASLTVMELSMNQVIRASIPVLVALLAVCIEGKVPAKSEVRARASTHAIVSACRARCAHAVCRLRHRVAV